MIDPRASLLSEQGRLQTAIREAVGMADFDAVGRLSTELEAIRHQLCSSAVVITTNRAALLPGSSNLVDDITGVRYILPESLFTTPSPLYASDSSVNLSEAHVFVHI